MEVVMGALPSLQIKLGDLLVGEYNLQKGVKGDIRFLRGELESMHGALAEISRMPADHLKNLDKIWARDVRELSYDIEDSIDTFMVRGECSEPAGPHGFKKFIDRSLRLLTRLQIRRNIATDIRDIKSRVEEVAKRRDRYKIGYAAAKHVTATIDPGLLAQYKKATELVGIDEARDEIIKMLIEGNEVSLQQDKIISIFGFGGLGKTTLANAVSEKIRTRFDCWASVSVSQTPNIKKLLKAMLYQFYKNIQSNNEETMDYIKGMLYLFDRKYWNEDTLDDRQLIDELREFLRRKRYLIVIDDIWDISVWNIIRCALPDDNGGYRIITTTRIFMVAEQIGSVYKVKPLCHRNSRILLHRTIFGNEEKDDCHDQQLAEVSDKILQKCAGVPLAIITIASLLASKGINKIEWYNVYKSIGTGLEDSLDVKNMRKILSLSYYDLPSHLRTCLLYLSVFPENHDIDKDRLIWMWIAEGFIQGEKQGNTLFELGESYFSELINRSMIQPVYDEYYGLIISCRAHDMVLDFIHSLSSEENFVTIFNDVHLTSQSKKIRRLSLQNSNLDHAMPLATMSTQQLRSLIVFPSAVSLIPALLSFRILRVLDLQHCHLSQGYNLKYIGNLFHLRYLGLAKMGITQLPEEIGGLQFLQTLDVRGNGISVLPSTFVQLRNLMCLLVDKHTRVPMGIRYLTSLEKLSKLWINQSTNIIEELGHLTELRVLDIDCRTRWNISLEKSMLECLCKLQKLEILFISFFGVCKLDAWVTPRKLRRLGLDGWISTLPAWMMDPLPFLHLSFLDIAVRELRQEDLEILGRLPALRYLWLVLDHENVKILDRLVIGACSFPCLVECVLWEFRVCVVFRQGAMPRLTDLQFTFPVPEMREIFDNNGGFDLGLENLKSLHLVTVNLRSGGASKQEVEEAKAGLRHATKIHPNQPALEIFG